MIKKITVKVFLFHIILVISLFIFFTTCDQKKSEEKPPLTEVIKEETNVYAPIQSENPLITANVTLKPVRNGNGVKIGDYADILFSTDLWSMAGIDNLQEFYSNRMKNFQTNWTCIRFENGNGIVFAGNGLIGSYGQLSNDGTVVDVIKYLKIGDKEVLKVD